MVKELLVISKSKSLVREIYKIVKIIPEEKYILVPQMLRSAISVPSNLAEGSQRTPKDFARFVRISRGSLSELKVQLEIAYDIYGFRFKDSYSEVLSLIDEIGKMTYGLLLKLKTQTV